MPRSSLFSPVTINLSAGAEESLSSSSIFFPPPPPDGQMIRDELAGFPPFSPYLRRCSSPFFLLYLAFWVFFFPPLSAHWPDPASLPFPLLPHIMTRADFSFPSPFPSPFNLFFSHLGASATPGHSLPLFQDVGSFPS